MKVSVDLRTNKEFKHERIFDDAPRTRDNIMTHTYSARICARAQRMHSCLVIAMAMVVSGGTLLAAGPEPVELGTAADFGALAVGAISGTGHVKGDVGSGAGAIAPAITSTGTIYPTGDAVATTALDDVSTAYTDGMNRPYDILLSAAAYELGGKTLTPGVYRIGGAATLATPVTLNAKGDPDAVFIIQIIGALGTTAAEGNVLLLNDAQPANVYWIVEGAVSMGAGTHMEGTILGGATITFGADTTINGRLLAGSAAGTIAIDTTISAVTGTPPVGSPPPIVVADTVTDADGNYLFENVQPGMLIVRWDLSSVTGA